MRKTLILSLLLFLVPVSAETSTEENVEERAAKFNKFLAHTISMTMATVILNTWAGI